MKIEHITGEVWLLDLSVFGDLPRDQEIKKISVIAMFTKFKCSYKTTSGYGMSQL